MPRHLAVLAALLLALGLGSLVIPGGPAARPVALAQELAPPIQGVELEPWQILPTQTLPGQPPLGPLAPRRGGSELELPDPPVVLDPDGADLDGLLTGPPFRIPLRLDSSPASHEAGDHAEPEASPEPGPSARDLEELPWGELLADLRDDEVRWNATHAARELFSRVWSGAVTEQHWVEAEELLGSPDRQQDLLVSALLLRMTARRADEGRPPRPLHPVLQERALAWLDGAPAVAYVPPLTLSRGLVTQACMVHVQELHEELGAIASQVGHRARFRAAFVLGVTGRTAWSTVVAEALIPHLRANFIEGDACMALHALQELGPFVAPQLALARAHADPQQARCLDALLAECDELGSGAEVDLRGVSWRTRSPLEHWTYVPEWDGTRVAPWIRKD